MKKNIQSVLEQKIFELIVKTSTKLPDDVLDALEKARNLEDKKSIAHSQLSIMLENAKIAKEKQYPLCQDTGTLLFSVSIANFAKSQEIISKAIKSAVSKASKEGFLRANTVSSFTGKPYANNIQKNFPQIEFDFARDMKNISIRLLMKGGGSENISCQYSLPDESLGAERDLDGIRKVIIDSVIKAQGKGCPPGAVAVCVGGDRAIGFAAAKKLFFREIGQRNPDKKIAAIEKSILKEINSLGIGAQGLGGKVFALELFIDFLPRHPASFFVTVSHMCWAWRKSQILIKNDLRFK